MKKLLLATLAVAALAWNAKAEDPPKVFGILTHHQKLPCAEPGPDYKLSTRDKDKMAGWETFEAIKKPGTTDEYYIRTHHGMYFGHGENTPLELHHRAMRDAFKFEKVGEGWAIKSVKNGRYMCFHPDGKVDCTRDRILDWETVRLLPGKREEAVRGTVQSLKEKLLEQIRQKLEEKAQEFAQGNEGKATVELNLDEKNLKLTGKITIRHYHRWYKKTGPITWVDGPAYDHTHSVEFYFDLVTQQGDAELDMSVSIAGNKIPIKIKASEIILAMVGG